MTHKQGLVLFIVIMVAAFIVGGFIQVAAFFGAITLLGLVVVVESIAPLKWMLQRTSKVVDVIILGATIIATANLGLNITAALTVAGIGYTLIYAPYIREQRAVTKSQPKPIGNTISKYKK